MEAEERDRALWGDDGPAVRVAVDALFGAHPERGGAEREQAAYKVVQALKAAGMVAPRGSEFVPYDDAKRAGALRIRENGETVVSIVFIREAPGTPHVFLGAPAIAMLPPEIQAAYKDAI